jgi:hypothetical protein
LRRSEVAGTLASMRLILLILALLTAPALAQGWERYDNARFGYAIDIPPGFVGDGESDNGDGQSFYDATGAKGLLLWGGSLMGDFEGEVASAIEYAQAENGWNITYEATTPRWASFSALKGFRILYQRMILLCDGSSYAAFRAEYSVTDSAEMEPVVEKLVQTLKGNGC